MYGDKLIDEKDMEMCNKMKYESAKAHFEVNGSTTLIVMWL